MSDSERSERSERAAIQARGRDGEARRTRALAVLLIFLSLLVAAVAAKNQALATISGRLSAALLEAVLLQVAFVTLQVSSGRWWQGRRANPAGRRLSVPESTRRHPERALGWLLTLLPIGVAVQVFEGCGLRLFPHSVGAQLVASSPDQVWSAVRLLCLITVVVALAAIGFARTSTAAGPADTAPARSSTPPDRRTSTANADPLVLAFSGGGIRSASFCLGGFNSLQPRPALREVDAIVAVSGGSYTAAAISLSRSFDANGVRLYPAAQPLLEDAYSLTSPELSYLRRNSRYIFQPWWRTLSGIWQLIGGAVLNLFLAVALLRGLAWGLGWYLQAVGLMPDLRTNHPRLDLTTHRLRDWLLVSGLWAVPLILVGLLLVVQTVRRAVHAPPIGRPSQAWWARAIAACGRITVIGLLALVVLPAAIVGVSSAGYHNTGGATLARVIVNLGFTRPDACRTALLEDAASKHRHAQAQARLEGDREDQTFGACGLTGTVAVGGPPSYADGYSPADVATTAKGFQAKTGIGGQLLSVVALVAAALGSLRRSFGSIASASSGRFTAIRRWLMLRLPLAVLGLLALWMLSLWTYQYGINSGTRAQILAPLIVVAGVILQLVNPNLTSIHEFYRERLSSAFAVGRDPADPAVAAQMPYETRYLLSEVTSSPELVLCTTANINDQVAVPTRRFGVPLTVSQTDVRLESGGVLPKIGYQPTEAFERDPRGPVLSVMGAVAMSGAAVSPMMGRMDGKVAPFRLLLTLFNVRLGVWVTNPRWPLDEPDAPAWAPMATNPRFHQLFGEAFGSTKIDDRWIYVTDGGHLDNLGLVEAVRRMPRRVLAFSASNDPDGSWQDVGSATSVIRADLGIDLAATDRDYQDSWMRLTAAPPYDIDVLVIRASLLDPKKVADTGSAPPGRPASAADQARRQWDIEHPTPVDVLAFDTMDKTFPRTSTGRQDFGDLEFESYRRLGEYLVDRAIAANPDFLG
jgi:hypothetical protein